MRRVVITGLGIVSCIGNNKEEVLTSLRGQTSGIRYIPEYEDAGFRSHIAGRPQINPDDHIDRKQRRFMGDSAAYSYIALKEAIADAGLSEDMVSSPRTGLIAGSGGASSSDIVEAVDTLREKGIRRVGPYRVTRSMGSTVSANLATPFSIRGMNYSITSACATSAHCIGNAMELIQWGKQDIMFAGGGEEEHWTLTMQFDAMGALSTKYNDTPDKASRPYDATRDGFVIAGGAGMVVLEEYEHAVKRGATIYAEIIGYGATSDGADMVAPSGEGAERCMRDALEMAGNPNIDYLNTHGTSTPAGDICELDAVKRAFSGNVPPFSSTKSLTGHSLGAAGGQGAIYCLLMQKDGFITGSANVTERDPGAADVPLVTENRDASLTTIMSNSFGFGGTNATLVFKKV
ncbi:MAG: beta-ketoacyl-[acyl-carrier-protein] synthase I [Oceanospirillaceae bacterium]|nr:beta-ketoacyl-[acyl-carrier-protein] synthase I [Oceanospirillaceae bacterium]